MTDDLERDEILHRKTQIFRWVREEHLDIPITSHNETFNRKILKYLDKRIDYWASYSTRHSLAVIDQNDGLDVMISKVRIIATETAFSYSDTCNILKFVQERSRQVIRNRNAIHQRNEARKEQFANEKKELAGFDFDKVIE